MKPRISMITLGVRDLSASIKFYEEGLGFPRLESPPEVAFFPSTEPGWVFTAGMPLRPTPRCLRKEADSNPSL